MSLQHAFAKAYERLPLELDPVLDAAKHMLVTTGKVWQPVERLSGNHPKTGRPMRVVVVDEQPSVTYFLRHLVGDEPRRERIGVVSWWSIGETLDRLAADADAMAVRIDRRLGQFHFDRAFLRLPEAINMVLKAHHESGGTARAKRSQSRNLREIARNRLTWRMTPAEGEFDEWYDDWYVPFVRERFGEGGYLRSRHRLRRYRDRGLLWICQDGRPLTGELVAVQGGRLQIMAGGAKDIKLARATGASVAAYKFGLEYAEQRGLDAVDMGGCRPSLADGVLTHKKRWGGGVELTHRLQHDIVIDWPQWSPEVADLLRTTSPIVREGSRCVGVTAAEPDADRKALRNELLVAGLDRIEVYHPDGQPL